MIRWNTKYSNDWANIKHGQLRFSCGATRRLRLMSKKWDVVNIGYDSGKFYIKPATNGCGAKMSSLGQKRGPQKGVSMVGFLKYCGARKSAIGDYRVTKKNGTLVLTKIQQEGVEKKAKIKKISAKTLKLSQKGRWPE